ncbi:MAG TPA: pyridoxamine 5'-phosphate oxidase family protein [Xanthobacteraceae bacterium]|nr:pyridoxamine 5'-phosphate oxidase family protein [Xanthobacteraceae bacterium]
MATTSHVDRVWELMGRISVCMLTTHDGEKIRSRPMPAYVRHEDAAVYFLTDAQAHKDAEIRGNPNVGLGFADGHKFVSVTGRAEVSQDRAKIRELWSSGAKAWWDSPDDPNIRLLTVTPDDAEFWEGPGMSTIKLAADAATHARPGYETSVKAAM